MKIGERQRLVDRVRQIRRVNKTTEAQPGGDVREPDHTHEVSEPDRAEIGVLEQRVAHLEQLLEGLQDSVHRESERQSKRIAELETQIQPAVLGEALSKDARNRGL
jgi:hypothetical protein